MGPKWAVGGKDGWIRMVMKMIRAPRPSSVSRIVNAQPNSLGKRAVDSIRSLHLSINNTSFIDKCKGLGRGRHGWRASILLSAIRQRHGPGTMKLSARNQLKGKIVEVRKGTTTGHVRID